MGTYLGTPLQPKFKYIVVTAALYYFVTRIVLHVVQFVLHEQVFRAHLVAADQQSLKCELVLKKIIATRDPQLSQNNTGFFIGFLREFHLKFENLSRPTHDTDDSQKFVYLKYIILKFMHQGRRTFFRSYNLSIF